MSKLEMKKSRKVAFYGIFAALAILMGYVEAMIPIPLPVPGIKLGLSNIIVVLALYIFGGKEGMAISLVRVAVSALLFKGFTGFWYSMAGAVLSFLVMLPLSKINKVSIVGTSITGGVFHNIGQIIIACIILGRTVVIYLLPILMVSGVVTGFAIGIISKYCINYVEKRVN